VTTDLRHLQHLWPSLRQLGPDLYILPSTGQLYGNELSIASWSAFRRVQLGNLEVTCDNIIKSELPLKLRRATDADHRRQAFQEALGTTDFYEAQLLARDLSAETQEALRGRPTVMGRLRRAMGVSRRHKRAELVADATSAAHDSGQGLHRAGMNGAPFDMAALYLESLASHESGEWTRDFIDAYRMDLPVALRASGNHPGLAGVDTISGLVEYIHKERDRVGDIAAVFPDDNEWPAVMTYIESQAAVFKAAARDLLVEDEL
jgi:hypothetical protein